MSRVTANQRSRPKQASRTQARKKLITELAHVRLCQQLRAQVMEEEKARIARATGMAELMGYDDLESAAADISPPEIDAAATEIQAQGMENGVDPTQAPDSEGADE